eukprot:jgi/Chlat1/441/Chrsp103S01013
MADMDSWEDQADTPPPQPAQSPPPPQPAAASAGLRADAKPFTFSSAAPTFVPGQGFVSASAPAPTVVSPPVQAAPVPVVSPASTPQAPPPTPQHDDMHEDAPHKEADEDAEDKPHAPVGITAAENAMRRLKANDESPAKGKSDSAPSSQVSSRAPSEMSEDDRDHEVPEDEDQREHLNLVFIGHVDAGKSTIGGQILFLCGMVDDRTIQKYEREAKEKNRDSWYMAYIMDTNEEERSKGITVEVGRAHFETPNRRYTILDAPGHKNYVPNMISGAAQADVGVLVISARKGEFETGFERGGQTREHAQLAKTLGVSKLVVVINKMDEPSVEWSKERFDEIVTKLSPFLKHCGYNTKKDVQFLPISGMLGINLKDRIKPGICPWWDGPSLFEALDQLQAVERDPNAPFRMPVLDKYRDMGTVLMGKIESGTVRRGNNMLLMPNKVPVKVITVYRDSDEVNMCRPGENVRLRVSGIEEDDVSSGFVLSSVERSVKPATQMDVQLAILELLEHKAIFTAGYKCVLHIHAAVKECEVTELLSEIDSKTKKPKKKKPMFVKGGALVVCRIVVPEAICVELFSDFPQLGRFTLRDEGKTIAIGKIVGLEA